ncbi:hypothetical protein L596_012491 [Steinernema carpocapsae]|uniref:Uncharacterized protein n=1 Tax=Steinernema carpocapsae TaxID=34508 RepID=A0A4U5NY15_STECR|nr:hypothetical protein L596_012491 [Steinernema carpocapsae]
MSVAGNVVRIRDASGRVFGSGFQVRIRIGSGNPKGTRQEPFQPEGRLLSGGFLTSFNYTPPTVDHSVLYFDDLINIYSIFFVRDIKAIPTTLLSDPGGLDRQFLKVHISECVGAERKERKHCERIELVDKTDLESLGSGHVSNLTAKRKNNN